MTVEFVKGRVTISVLVESAEAIRALTKAHQYEVVSSTRHEILDAIIIKASPDVDLSAMFGAAREKGLAVFGPILSSRNAQFALALPAEAAEGVTVWNWEYDVFSLEGLQHEQRHGEGETSSGAESGAGEGEPSDPPSVGEGVADAPSEAGAGSRHSG